MAAVGAALLLTAGCASLGSSRGTSHGPAPPGDSLSDYINKVRRLSVEARPNRPELPSMESELPELRAGLAALRVRATPERHRQVADAYRKARVLDLAYDHYSAARNLDSTDAAAYDGLARIWRDWGVPQLGLGDARRAVYFAPQWATAYNTLGTLLQALGQPAEARRAFERALALDSGAAYAWTNLCYQSFQAGDLNTATTECNRALALEPGLVAAHHNLALVHAAAGDLAASRQALAAAGTDEAVRHFNTGVVLSAGRRYLEAAQSFDAAYRLRPEWTYAADRAKQARRLAE
jgi:tetratricopeptide (TPR) repeat protein